MDLVTALGAQLGPVGSFAKAVVEPKPASTALQTVAARPADRPSGNTLLGALFGVSVGTAVAAGVGYGLGAWMYPETGGAPFAKVSAVGYLIPIGLFVGVSTIAAYEREW